MGITDTCLVPPPVFFCKDVYWVGIGPGCTEKRGRSLGRCAHLWGTAVSQLWCQYFEAAVHTHQVFCCFAWSCQLLFLQVLDHTCSTPWGLHLPSWEPQAPSTTRPRILRGWVPTQESTAAPSTSCHPHPWSKCYFLVTMVARYVELWVC